MSSDYQKQYQKEYGNLILEMEDLKRLIKNLTSTISTLNGTINIMNTTIQAKDEENKKLILEIERLKNNNNKDSSNSGKPSSKNGFKKVIHNSREKTDRKQGGQKDHKGHTSKPSKANKLIDEGRAKNTVIEVNKSQDNQNKHYKVRYVQDIEISTVIREYRYYPDNKGSYNIPKDQNNILTYGSNIKATSMLLVHRVLSSVDQTVNFLNAITNGDFDLTKATIVNWSNFLSDQLDPFTEEILQSLYNANYVHTDESPININGKNHQLHNYSNDKYTLQYMHRNKTKDAMIELGFLPN